MKSFDIKSKKKKIPEPERKPASQAPVSAARIQNVKGLPWSRKVVAAGLVAVIIVGLLVFLVLPEAKIEVTARTEPVTRDFEIRIDKNQSEPNSSELIVPAQLLEKEVEGTKTFQATGTKNTGHKASGFVTIYNFSKTTLILKAQTTILEAGGHQYIFTQDVGSIRPTAFIGLENQEIDESSLIPPVPIIAAGPGAEYNLSKGTRVEIKNEVFGHQPKSLYGVAADSITGGTDQIIKVITEQDLLGAAPALIQEVLEKAKKDIMTQNPNLKIDDSAISYDILEQKTSLNPGKEAQEFEATAKLKLRALAYDEQQIKNVISERIKRLLPQSQILQTEKSVQLSTKLLSASMDAGSGILSSHYEGQIYYKIDGQELLAKLKGKSLEEISEIVLSRPEIKDVTIKFFPFWVKKAPKFVKRINLVIRVD